jgi:uncharacterized protein (DUF1015 family)
MADVRPFRGITYNADRAGDLSLNVCPPFDMITPALQRDLYGRSQFNIVRLELSRRGQPSDPYSQSAVTHQLWMDSGVLVRDNAPAMYVTEEQFPYAGQTHTRRGLIAAVRVEEYDRSVVLPHENTRLEWVNDRVRLMQSARANYSTLLVLFRDNIRHAVGGIMRAVAGGRPTAAASPPDMHSVKMWRVTDPGTLEVISHSLAGSQLFIADGHHRYEAALRYRSRIRSEREVSPAESLNFRMMMLVSLDEPGLMTLGYHRVIARTTFEELDLVREAISSNFDLTLWTPTGSETPQAAAVEFQAALGRRDGAEVVFGLYGYESGKFHVARMRRMPAGANELEGSEYSQLHNLVFKPAFDPNRENESLMFFPRPDRAVATVDDQGGQMAFIMRPVPMREFTAIVSRGWRLPPKATNFYPKPPAGTVIQSLEGEL